MRMSPKKKKQGTAAGSAAASRWQPEGELGLLHGCSESWNGGVTMNTPGDAFAYALGQQPCPMKSLNMCEQVRSVYAYRLLLAAHSVVHSPARMYTSLHEKNSATGLWMYANTAYAKKFRRVCIHTPRVCIHVCVCIYVLTDTGTLCCVKNVAASAFPKVVHTFSS